MYLGKRRKLNRWPGFDYSLPGLYFVTICTKRRQLCFGEVVIDRVSLNELGEIAQNFWLKIPQHFDNCELDEFIVMPNHLHGIIYIRNEHNKIVGDADLRPLQKAKMSLPKIIHQFKSSVTREINIRYNLDFAWQRSFHDRVIRNEKELKIKRQYIANNPINWQNSKNNPINFITDRIN